jgi:DNA-binding beta-propeller fold protein YncE
MNRHAKSRPARFLRVPLGSAFIVVALLLGGSLAAAPAPTEDDFVVLSGPESPRVAFAVSRDGAALNLTLDVAGAAGPGSTSVSVGLAAAKAVVLNKGTAPVHVRDGTARYVFAVPAASLVAGEADWARLRMGIAVAWSGGPLGNDRQRERFRHLDALPAHAGLSASPADWAPLDLAEYAAAVADRKRRITFDLDQPMDGKATVVIEDADGGRVRNLIAGQPLSKGRRRLEWDGLDEQGNVVKPGQYRWRAASHPGIVPEDLFSFCNDGNPPWRTGSGADMWGPDHSCLVAAAAGKDWTFFAGWCAESGYAIVAVDAQGTKRMHYNPPSGTGIERVALAADDKFLYAAHDGFAWGQHVDRSKPGWKAAQKLTVTRFDIPTGKVVDFPGGQRFVAVSASDVGPGAGSPRSDPADLAGLAIVSGKLFVSSRIADAILVVDAATGKRAGEIKLESPRALAASKDNLIAVSRDRLVRINPATGAATPLIAAGLASPQGVAVDAAGNIYASDGQSHTVKAFDAAGKPIREIGKPGGPYAGRYDPERMVNPRGVAVAPNGWLWVTEDRWNPKRTVAWDLASGRVVKEKFGPTSYGAAGAGFDGKDSTVWVGQGALWKLDFAKQSAVPVSILAKLPEHLGGYMKGQLHYRFLHQDGRTFLIGLGKATTVSELKADGSMRDLAAVGSTHRFSYGCDWKPPEAFIEAFNRAYPGKQGKHADKGPGVLWVDKNGDGLCQADEFDFATDCAYFAGAGWGNDASDLTLRVPAVMKGRTVLVTLKPDGSWPGGAPKYPGLNDACAKAVPIDLRGSEIETSVDRFGNVVCNSDPTMKCFAPDGRTLWTYPNQWTNVHGSHAAPLPETGVMQGALFFLGMAPLDARADVFVMNGNHGRFFALTSDGLYLDEMFKDVRMGAAVDAYLIGGECFGGFFGRSETDGQYYLQSGHTDYRIFRLRGLSEVKRSQGDVGVTPEQAVASANNLRRKAEATAAAKEAVIPFRAKPPAIDGKDDDWPREDEILWSRSGKFPVRVRAAYDAQNLYLCWIVQDPSPWVNNGKDWTLLFKTGDSVNFELGSVPAADSNRKGPAPGDVRLLIAPFEGKDIAVLYRYRAPGAKNPVTFTCPWRSERVDEVRRLDGARIAVARREGEYAVKAAIPLAELGLQAPGGTSLRGDFGVIFGDPVGQINMLRSWWSNQATGLVNDVPGEIMIAPNLWGRLTFGKEKQP